MRFTSFTSVPVVCHTRFLRHVAYRNAQRYQQRQAKNTQPILLYGQFYQQHDNVTGDRVTMPNRVDLFMSLALEVDLRQVAIQ